MQKHSFAVLIAAFSALILVGCAKEATEVSFAEVCDPKYDHQRLSTVGYFDARVSEYCSDSGGDYRCGMDFLESPDSENRFTADVLEGNGRNQLPKLPDDYTAADIKVKTADGGEIGVGQKARITGDMLIGEGVCLMTVRTIEAVTD